MKLSFLIMLALFASSAEAQPGRWFDPLAQVKQFLQLSDSQLQTILSNNDEYNRWSFEKQARIRQVQSEIAEETARQPLDPSALGIRYAEVESICREMKDRANSYRGRNLGVLSQDQKVKMTVLEDAMKLVPIIAEAQSGNLIGINSVPYAFTSSSTGIGGSIIGGLIGPANGCYLPFPTGVVRTGDFTATLSNKNVVRLWSDPGRLSLGSTPSLSGNEAAFCPRDGSASNPAIVAAAEDAIISKA